MSMRPSTLAVVALLLGCGHKARFNSDGAVFVPAGRLTTGSSLDERASALDLAYRTHHGAVAGSVASLRDEPTKRAVKVAGFYVMVHPVTNRGYFDFVVETGAPEPWVGEPEATQFLWHRGRPRPERVEHPVVLVTRDEASDYCAWWGEQKGGAGDLPSEAQWERSARGDRARAYPWGDAFAPAAANTIESGLRNTTEVGSYPSSASPYGVQGLAGNVSEWTRTRNKTGEFVVKGGSWDSDGATARTAARRFERRGVRHIAIGFRCVLRPA